MNVAKIIRYSLIATLLTLLQTVVFAQTSNSSYEALQAAYLYNFAKYIKWPENISSFVIGVIGEEDIMNDMATLVGKKISGKEIIVKQITEMEQIAECKIVYLSDEGSKELQTVTSNYAGKSILIVTEEDLIKKGAMISFVVEDDKLKFKLKKSALQKANLIVSEGLLNLAIVL